MARAWPWPILQQGPFCFSNVHGHITKIASMPIYGKNFQNLLLRNQEADDLETWHTASGTQVLPVLFKWWQWVDLNHFYDVKFVS